MKLRDNKNATTVLFVCVENSGRSQIAEGFFKKYAPKEFKVQSAGDKTNFTNQSYCSKINERNRNRYPSTKSKGLTDEMIRNSNHIVNMGCMDKSFCPTIFLPKVIEWNLEDPKGKAIEEVREIRNEIEKMVKELVSAITIITEK